MKTVLIQIAGAVAAGEPQKYAIDPGVTAGQVLEHLGLTGYQLSHPGQGGFFAADEEIYPAVEDGQTLQATVKARVG